MATCNLAFNNQAPVSAPFVAMSIITIMKQNESIAMPRTLTNHSKKIKKSAH